MIPKTVRKDVSLRLHCSWKVGGPADFLCQPQNTEELAEVLSWADESSLPITVISGGTNILIRDGGIRGLVISMRSMAGMETEKTNDRLVIVAEAGCRKAQVFRVFLKEGLAPAEFLSGLPGDMGGGVVMNAGVSEDIKPREFCEIVDWVEVMSRNDNGHYAVQRLNSRDLTWSYRHCLGWQPGVVTKVSVSWPLQTDPGLKERVQLASQSRKARQPLELPSCGSVFVNPPGDKAGRLIESCGLKGKWFGGAQISEKHANFIVNRGEATAADIEAAIRHVQATVLEKTGVQLQTEVVFLGEAL